MVPDQMTSFDVLLVVKDSRRGLEICSCVMIVVLQKERGVITGGSYTSTVSCLALKRAGPARCQVRCT
jgi:hypothetical protein